MTNQEALLLLAEGRAIVRRSRSTRHAIVTSVVVLFGLVLLAGFWGTARPPESEAVLDLSEGLSDEIVTEMWEVNSDGLPQLTNFFRFTGTQGRLFECQEVVGHAAQEGIQ